MIKTFTGTNSFSLKRALDQAIAEYLKLMGSDMGLERIDAEADMQSLQGSLLGVSFLVSKKMVVLEDPSLNKALLEKLPELLTQVYEDTDVIIVEHKLDKRTAWNTYLQKNTSYTLFEELRGGQLTSWVVSYTRSKQSELSNTDALYLVDRVGPNQQLLSMEIEKLSCLGNKITREAIDELTVPSMQSTVFNLLDAAMKGRLDTALQMYEEQRKLRVEPQAILAMIIWQLHILALVAASGNSSVPSEAKISPFVLDKSRQLVKNGMGLGRVKKLVAKTRMLDNKMKTVAVDADETVTYLIAAIASQ